MIALFTLTYNSGLLAQDTSRYLSKPLIDSSLYGKWGGINIQSISNDGNYAGYGSYTEMGYVIQAIHTNWKVKLFRARDLSFSPDSKLAIYQLDEDSLAILSLGTSTIEYLTNVISYTLLEKGNASWLIYLLRLPYNKLIVRSLQTGSEKVFENVLRYVVNQPDKRNMNPSALLLQVKDLTKGTTSFNWMDMTTGYLTKISDEEDANSFEFNENATCTAFITDVKTDGQMKKNLCYYHAGMKRAEILLDSHSGLDEGFSMSAIEGFNADGSKLFVKLRYPKLAARPIANAPKVNIWTYFDPKLQSVQLKEGGEQTQFTYVVHTNDHKIVRLEMERETIFSPLRNCKDDFVLVLHHGTGDMAEDHWNRTTQTEIYLVSTGDGSRKFITSNLPEKVLSLSPEEKYVVYYDPEQKNYYSYEIATGVRHNITKSISTIWTSYDRNDEERPIHLETMGFAGWLENDKAVLIYNQNDIIRADPQGKQLPDNLTDGYGWHHHIIFHLGEEYSDENYQKPIAAGSRNLLLTAFNRATKDEGFFNLDLSKRNGLHELTMQPCKFTQLTKARNAETYLVVKESADFFPNIFSTLDLMQFTPLTDIHPEKKFNWITSELITWRQLDGQMTQGVLYKPGDFDPRRKYPLIFRYYERLTDDMHEFLRPGPNGAIIDVPTYVSNGYLVVCADIHFKMGNPGQSAYNSIVAGAAVLSKKRWVDSKKIGLDGHSYGAYMTNYIVTHCNLFAAAIAASGWSNFISASNRIKTNGHYAQDYYEVGKQRMGGNLWDRPGNYIQASPIFQAQHLTTPVLLMNNKDDEDVNFYEGIQFFTALRRLGKKCWMLQYDGEGHVLTNNNDIRDFMIREQQFLDYYLKGAPAPKWMVEGIPASRKGADLGYELEDSSMGPGVNLLKSEERKKVDSLQSKPMNLSIK